MNCAIASAPAQEYRTIEIIVVDDASTDESCATVEALAVWMNSYPATTIAVEGHADVAVGRARAQFLAGHVVDPRELLGLSV